MRKLGTTWASAHFIVAGIALALLAVSWPTPASITKVGNFAGTTIYPAAISGIVNDWAPANLSAATTIVEAISADTTLTGLTGGIEGRRVDICNTGLFTLTLTHDTGSLPANRFYLAEAQNWTLDSLGASCASFVYDGTAARWRMDAKTGNTFPSINVVSTSAATAVSDTAVINGGAQALKTFQAGGALDTIALARAGTSLASPTPVANNTALGELDYKGYNGSTYITGASIIGRAVGAYSLTNHALQWEFNTTAIGATALTIDVFLVAGQRATIGTGAAPGTMIIGIGPVDGSFTAAFGGHVNTNGAAVAFSTCGVGPVCNSTTCNDTAGTFTTGSGATTCTLTFVNTYTGVNSAGCVINPIGVATLPTYATSATSIIMSVSIASTKYHYICIGH